MPPHSTTVKPVRAGAVSAWAGSFTKESELCQAMNTRIRVSGAGQEDYVTEEIVNKYHFGKVRAVVSGGKERYDSVWNGLKAVRDGMAGEEAKEGYVYIHDGARPFVDEQIIKRGYACVKANRACVAGVPSKDTVKIVDENQFAVNTPVRKYVWIVQTPQVFETELITQASKNLMEHDRETVTDDAMVVEQEMQIPVKLYEGSYCNIKITTPEDLDTAKGFIEHIKS